MEESTEARASGTGETPSAVPEFLLVEHFQPYVGRIVRFKGTRYAFPLDHIDIHADEPPSWATRRPFTLIFRGPKERDVLPEGLYACEIDGGPTYDIHVAPIFTPRPDCQDYQAVFS